MLSIIIPAYNEEKTIEKLVSRLKEAKLEGIKKEILVVNDASQDLTLEKLKKIKGIKILSHKRNMGKGAAVKTGLENSQGDILLIQDADLEYDPGDIRKIIEPILNKRAEIVFGSRNLAGRKSYSSLVFFVGGLLIEFITNKILNTNLTDSLTGSKAFTRKVYKRISPIKSNGFEIEAEITAKSVKSGFKIIEVPISYKARTIKEGKKIKWYHAFELLDAVWKYSR